MQKSEESPCQEVKTEKEEEEQAKPPPDPSHRCPHCGGSTDDNHKDVVIPYRERPTLHILGIFHTIHSKKYSHCAFTGKALRFSKMMKMYGWKTIEYANEGSESDADEKVPMLSEERLLELRQRKTETEFVGKDAIVGSPWWAEFDMKLRIEILKRAKPGDIICYPLGNTHPNLTELLPECYHVETGIGYPDAFLAFRIYESSAWMHYHLGRDKDSGKNYNWVIPNYYDLEEWDVCLEPDSYILCFGRLNVEKGMDQLLEIAKNVKRKVVICGQGDPGPWVKESTNLIYKAPIHGKERNKLLGRAYCIVMPSLFIEPFGGSGVEAMLCGTPLLACNYGAFQETVVHGVTGFLCNTLGDWLDAIKAVKTLDRARVAEVSRGKFSLQACGKKYDVVLRQVADLARYLCIPFSHQTHCNLFRDGWYAKRSFALQGEIAGDTEDSFKDSDIAADPLPPPAPEEKKSNLLPLNASNFGQSGLRNLKKLIEQPPKTSKQKEKLIRKLKSRREEKNKPNETPSKD